MILLHAIVSSCGHDGLDVALDLRHQRLQRLPRAVARRRRGRTAEHDAGNKTAKVEHRIRDDANST